MTAKFVQTARVTVKDHTSERCESQSRGFHAGRYQMDLRITLADLSARDTR